MVILCKRRNCPLSDTVSHLGRNVFSVLRWRNDLVIVLLMAAVQHLVRLARSCKLLCFPAALSPSTCDAGASDCCTIVASVCCVLLPTINGTFAMGHGFLKPYFNMSCHSHIIFWKKCEIWSLSSPCQSNLQFYNMLGFLWDSFLQVIFLFIPVCTGNR
jgi:hypothetical protein